MYLQNLDLHSLRILIDVVETKSFTATASNFHITQAAVSQHIKKLSDGIGHDLVYFEKKVLKLTPYGTILHNHASRISTIETELKNELTKINGSQVIRIGIIDTFFKHSMVNVINDYHLEYPNSPVEIMNYSSKKIANHVNSGELDLGIIGNYDNSSIGTYLTTEKLIWVCSKSKEALKIDPIPFVMIGTNSKLEDKAIKTAKKIDKQIKRIYLCSNSLCALELVITGSAISIIPEKLFDKNTMFDLTSKLGFPNAESYQVHLLRSSQNLTSNSILLEKLILSHYLH